MTRQIQIAPEEFYHLYNRGVEKRKIFLCRADYERFEALLYLANQSEPVDLKYQGRSFVEMCEVRAGESLVEVVAYCLMPNHFHLLVRERVEGGIAKFMQKVTTGYTMYFNKRNERSGALFEGTYKARHVSDDRYFRYLISYIHLNPIKLFDSKWKENDIQNRTGAERYLERYEHSSYLDYVGKDRAQALILEKKTLIDIFPSVGDFKTCVKEWLTYSTQQNKV
jgi:putative transposase